MFQRAEPSPEEVDGLEFSGSRMQRPEVSECRAKETLPAPATNPKSGYNGSEDVMEKKRTTRRYASQQVSPRDNDADEA